MRQQKSDKSSRSQIMRKQTEKDIQVYIFRYCFLNFCINQQVSFIRFGLDYVDSRNKIYENSVNPLKKKKSANSNQIQNSQHYTRKLDYFILAIFISNV